MRARITFAFVAILAVALILAGGVSLLLVRHAVSLDAQATVLRQALTLESAVKNPDTGKLVSTPSGLELLESITGGNVTPPFVVEGNGKISPTPAPGSLIAAIDGNLLLKGQPSKGVHDHIAFAAVPLFSYKPTGSNAAVSVAVVFESKESFSSDSVWFFLLASGLSLLAAGALGSVISSRVASRVTAVADAAKQIAEGDLSTRVAVGVESYPELVQLDQAINTMAENLERAREGERDFLLSISHDLRTPLTSIRGYAEAIADGAVPDLPRAAGVVVSEAGRLERLIGDLLDLARLRTRQFSFDLVELDLAIIVQNGAEAFRYEFEAAGVALEIDVGEDRVTFVGDPHRVGQIVANLIENALKFAATRVDIGLTALENGAVLTVTDDGPGIVEADLPFVFERLYTSSRNVARAAGTGLGLAIVTELGAAMHATVEVHSPVTDTGGTCFEVRFEAPRSGRSPSPDAASTSP